MENNFDNQDDILEFALNKGISAASFKFNIPIRVIFYMVNDFAKEICLPEDKPCSCEKLSQKGIYFMMCVNDFGCDSECSKRIKLFNK